MYDCLMDARIRLQKCVSPMNTLPDVSAGPYYFQNTFFSTRRRKQFFRTVKLFCCRVGRLYPNSLFGATQC